MGQQGLAALQGTGTNLGNIGQQLFGQNIAQGQAVQGLGQQQFAQGLAGAQGAANIGQNMFGQGAQTAGIQQAGGMNIANLGLQNQGAQIGAAQAQMAAGQQQQQTEQAARTALYNQYLQQQGYPFQIAQFLANIAEGTGSLSGSTTTATRTGYRGGRMGDGYASGGLVPPNSQGGIVYNPGAYGRGGYADGGMSYDPESNTYYQDLGEEGRRFSPEEYAAWSSNQDRSQQPATTSSSSQASTKPVSDKLTEAAKTDPALQQNISDYQAVSGVNKDVASAFKDATGKDIDAASARKYQDMLNAGMSLDQVKYNINTSQPALLQKGDVGALKGQSLAYNPANFSTPSAPVLNQFGSYAAPAPQQASGKGASQPQTQSYYGQPAYNYGGGYGGGYSQPSNYGMPNFGNYGGAPNYAGAAYYGGQQQYGYQPQYQQPQQASGKGASQPAQQQAQYYNAPGWGGSGINPELMGGQQQAPQATGKGASQPAQQAPTATGKGMSTGGRAAFASGGRAGYALQGAVPGDPYGILQAQQASFAGAPGAAMGYVPPTQGGAGQYKMMTPQASILPKEQSGLKEAIGMGTSIASLGEAGNKLYDKLKGPSTTAAQDAGSMFNKMGAAKQSELDKAGGLNSPNSGFKLFGDNSSAPDAMQTASMPDAVGKGVEALAARGGRIGYAGGGIPGLDDLKQGYAPTPGGAGEETPMSHVVSQGTQTPAELKGQMNAMSSGSGGLGGGSGGSGIAGAIGTAASIASLGNAAMSAGSWIGTNILPLLLLARGGRVGKAGGGALVDPSNPRDQAMAASFDNLLQRYDNNPLLAAAAMDVGTKAVDAAIMKAKKTGRDPEDFLPRRTQEYMFALSKAAIGAHDAMTRQERKSGGRTGYKEEGFVDDQPTGLVPAPKPSPSDSMTTGDVFGGLAPKGEQVQLAGPVPAADKGPDYDAIIGRASKETGIPADLLRAQIQQESSFNPNKVGKSGEIGLTQVLSSTAKKPGFGMAGVDPETLRDPEQSIMFGAKYLAARGQAAGVKDWNNPDEAAKGLRAYNGGGDPNYVANVYRHMGLTPPANVGEQKPVQTAGLAGGTKTDAGPFERTFGKAMPDSVPTDSSFWVPLIAGLGTFLASDKYRFSQRIGEGLVGGAAAYGKQQEFGLQKEKVGSELAKNSLGVLNDRFMELPNGMFYDKLYGTQVTPQQRASFASSLPGMSGMTGQAGAPSAAAPSTTKQEGAPRVEAPATAAPATTEQPAARPRVPDILAPLNEQPAKATEAPKVPTTAAEALDMAESHPKVQEQYATAKKYEEQALKAQREVELYTKEKPWLPNAATNATRAQNEQQNAERKASEAKARGEALRNQFAATDLKRIETLATTTAAETAKTHEVWTLDGEKIIVPGDKYREIAEKGGGEYNGKPVLAGQSPWVEPMVKSWGKFREDGQKFMEDYQDNRYKLTALGDIYSKFQSGKGAEALSDLAGYAKRFGIKLPESIGDPAAGFDAAYKAATDQAFEQMKSSGASKAPATGLREALITSARPEADPAAVYKILTDKLAALDYSADMIQHVVKSGTRDVTNGVIDFQRNTKFNPYVENSRKEIPLPKGITEAGKGIVTSETKPVVINGPDDIKNLERGTPFVIPYGPDKGKIGYAQ